MSQPCPECADAWKDNKDALCFSCDPAPTPEGFRLERIGGGFEAWTWMDADRSLEFRVFNLGWASAPRTVAELNERTGVEVFVDGPLDGAEAVAYMESHGLTGGDNGESGALSWYFDTAAEAVAWVRAKNDRPGEGESQA